MTQMTDEQWRQVDAAVERIGAKLRAFHDGLADGVCQPLGGTVRNGGK